KPGGSGPTCAQPAPPSGRNHPTRTPKVCAARPPDTAVTAVIALLSHLLDDGARTRRAVCLMAATILSAAMGVSLLVAVINLTGGAGLAAGITASAGGIVTTLLCRRPRSPKPPR